MSDIIVGIDVSKKDLSITIIIGSKTYQINILNDTVGFKKFSKWLREHSISKVKACMEATRSYGISFADYLYGQGHEVSVVNPLCISAFAKSKLARHKTDKVDSLIIAEYASKNELRAYIPKDPVMLELRDLYRCLQNLKSQQRQIKNFLANKKHMLQDAYNSYSQIAKSIIKEITNIEKKIDELLDKNNNLKEHVNNIITIPGVGKTTAIAVLAETPDLTLFKNARQMAAFAGLTPKHHTSGTSVNKRSCISKIGLKSLSTALYFPAIVAKRHNEHFSKFANTLQKKGRPPKVIIVAIMRKLIHMIFGIIKNKNQFNSNIGSVSLSV